MLNPHWFGTLLIIDSVPEPEVCPDAPPAAEPINTVAEWAEKRLHFTPSPHQADLLNNTSKRIILNCNRQWGKTTTVAIKALHHALHNPNSTIVVISRSKEQAGLLVNKVIEFASLLSIQDRRVRNQSHSIQLPNGSKIYAIAHSDETAPGRTADVLIVDEAGRVKDHIFAAVSPFVVRSGGAIWLLSTPRGQNGFFYTFWHNGDNVWTRMKSTVADCPGMNQDVLDMHKQMSPALYKQEFECEFTPAPGRLISREKVREMINDDIDQWVIT